MMMMMMMMMTSMYVIMRIQFNFFQEAILKINHRFYPSDPTKPIAKLHSRDITDSIT